MKIIEYKNINFYIGSNANDNWKLLEESKLINDNYVWFHLNSFPSPYIIMYSTIDELKNTRNDELNEILNYGANLCKENSKYKYLNHLKIIYTTLKKISKGDKIGEVIISGKKNILSI
jgi:predicted ribosome quality control (RQC) complex YloA/Tae2 family protein